MKNIQFIAALLFLLMVSACNSNRQKATLGNGVDTSNVKGAQVTPSFPADTAKKGADTSARGNADPSGSLQKSNK